MEFNTIKYSDSEIIIPISVSLDEVEPCLENIELFETQKLEVICENCEFSE